MAGVLFWDPIITFFLLSSLGTSEKASQMLGRGFIPNILPCTSSRFLLSPNKSLNILFFSMVLDLISSSGQS